MKIFLYQPTEPFIAILSSRVHPHSCRALFLRNTNLISSVSTQDDVCAKMLFALPWWWSKNTSSEQQLKIFVFPTCSNHWRRKFSTMGIVNEWRHKTKEFNYWKFSRRSRSNKKKGKRRWKVFDDFLINFFVVSSSRQQSFESVYELCSGGVIATLK